MLSDSIIYVGIVDTRSYQPWKNQGMERYTFPTVVCQSGGKSKWNIEIRGSKFLFWEGCM